MGDGVCPKCQSTEIIPQAHVIDQHVDGTDGRLTVAVYERPEAFIFRGKQQSTLYAWVCGTCGYAELYVGDPGGLLAAYRKARGR